MPVYVQLFIFLGSLVLIIYSISPGTFWLHFFPIVENRHVPTIFICVSGQANDLKYYRIHNMANCNIQIARATFFFKDLKHVTSYHIKR